MSDIIPPDAIVRDKKNQYVINENGPIYLENTSKNKGKNRSGNNVFVAKDRDSETFYVYSLGPVANVVNMTKDELSDELKQAFNLLRGGAETERLAVSEDPREREVTVQENTKYYLLQHDQQKIIYSILLQKTHLFDRKRCLHRCMITQPIHIF